MQQINVLLIEDDPDDARLLERELSRGGLRARLRRVETEEGLREALTSEPWDVVLADYALPALDAPSALGILRSTGLDVPFIVVSGCIGEDVAVQMMKMGAHDYLLKGHLARLAPAIGRELREADERRRRRVADQTSRVHAELLGRIGQAVVVVDRQRLVTFWNEAARGLYGWEAEEALGRPVPEVMKLESCGAASPNLWSHAEAGDAWAGEFIGQRRDGRSFPVHVTVAPVHALDGSVAGATSISTDLSAQRAAEAAFASLRRHNDLLLNAAGEGIVGLDLSGHATFVNPAAARILGQAADDLLGQRLLDLVHYKDAADLVGCGSPQAAEVVRRCDGSRLPVEVVSTPILEDAQVVGYVLVFKDVTERVEAERQRQALERSEKLRALGQLASGVAHDVNHSLMLVASHGELARRAVERQPLDLDEVREFCSTAIQAALDGGETVKRLLLFARGSPDQEQRPLRLAEIAEQVGRLTAPRWREAAAADGCPIQLDLAATSDPIVLGSPAGLREALTNLVLNAVDALPRGGTIRLGVSTEGQHAVVSVADSGVGMEVAVREHMFEPFFTTKHEGGTGLGLAEVFGIVQRHGGEIQVASAPGKGTTVRLLFPCLAAEALDKPETLAPTLPTLAGRSLRVLAVDDEPAMTKAVQRLLRPAGYRVSTAHSGEEALDRLSAEPFDVVVTDMGMGAGMNGYELAERVREQWPHVRMVLATGWGAAIDPGEARVHGIDAVLHKPYRASDLQRLLAA
jgi:two-component system, cell cycle sensor histidine kinase and response regulator CckA